jgi:hypothetical protein
MCTPGALDTLILKNSVDMFTLFPFPISEIVVSIAPPQDTLHILACMPVFMHGPQGSGPRAANFQGRHIKKSRLKYGMRKKKAVHERGI